MSGPPASIPPRSLRSPSGSFERSIDVEGSVVASFSNVFIQVRYGGLKLDGYERICAALLRHRMLTPRGSLHGAIALTEEGVPIPPEDVRARQRVFVSDHLKHPNVRLGIVVMGETMDATLLRSASRGVVPPHPQLRLFGEPEGACAWIAEQLALDKGRLSAAIAEARAIAAARATAERASAGPATGPASRR